MSYTPNPFRLRAAEQQSDSNQFVRSYGADLMAILPDSNEAWNRLVVLRSAPGAGKTSILRMLTPQSLRSAISAQRDTPALLAQLERIGCVSGGRPLILGILVGMKRDYRAITDLGPGGVANELLFLKLLESRILVRLVDAALQLLQADLIHGAKELTIHPRVGTEGEAARTAIERMIGVSDFLEHTDTWSVTGTDLLSAARRMEHEVLAITDSLTPVEPNLQAGHSTLYSLAMLDGVDLRYQGELVQGVPALLFDDVHELATDQRDTLYRLLMERRSNVARWVAERNSALSETALITLDSPEGRDYKTVWLEDLLGRNGSLMDRLLAEIGDRRAGPALATAAGQTLEPFSRLLVTPPGEEWASSDVAAQVRARVEREAPKRYWQSISELDQTLDVDASDQAVAWRSLLITVTRDLRKPEPTLFEEETVDVSSLTQFGSDVKGAARLFLANEFKLPYYFDHPRISALSNFNVEQYLSLAGDIFDALVGQARRRQHIRLSPADQDRVMRNASRNIWRSIPYRVPHGLDVYHLLQSIATLGRAETYRDNAPYAPGVTGIAFMSTEEQHLISAKTSKPTRLGSALASAVAHNLIELRRGTRVKHKTVNVVYLNRLLCPQFDLPLSRGGFREQPISRVESWLDYLGTTEWDGEPPDPDALMLPGLGRPSSLMAASDEE